MKNGNLPVIWVRWRRRRYQALVAEGLSSGLAWPLAAGEARLRHQISLIIGKDQARAAELTYVGLGRDMRLALTGSISGITDDQIEAIENLSKQSVKPTA